MFYLSLSFQPRWAASLKRLGSVITSDATGSLSEAESLATFEKNFISPLGEG